jgi:hypothetical protein
MDSKLDEPNMVQPGPISACDLESRLGEPHTKADRIAARTLVYSKHSYVARAIALVVA